MITYYSANYLLDYNFGRTGYTAPATYYFGLSTTPISIDGTGATEPSGGSYGRVSFTNSKSNWTTNASLGTLSNTTAITFPESTASWGTITYVFMSDALSGGNIWWYDALSPSRNIQSATTVQFAIGAVVIQMNNS